ncbi:MAG: protein kinase, partial [Candidatus Sericytochromatia bacterium]|nr:protein kinase [Candidatus Sericytochromatia bacterium]
MPDAEGLIGTLVGNRYQVLERLGAGGMAVVYRVLDQDTQRVWALKVMAAELAPDVAAQRRFKSEHRVMQALHHPGIPQVQALGLTAEGLPYFAMELVEGEALPAGETWPEGAIRNLVAELMPILAHLHRQGLVHGDLKAENLMRTTQGALKLMDFGLAGPAGTRAQGLEGTVSHLAPELIQRGRADQRSDLYAAGVLLYELAAGRLPHVGGSAAETLKLHLTAAPASLRSLRPELSADLEALIGRLLAKRPLDRPQSANEVLRALGLPAEEEDSLALPLQGPFVGRQTLLSQLVAAAGEAANGHRPRPIALLGAAGLGKSRLLEEAASQARLIDLPTVTGLCAADPIPYGPWVDLARELLALGRSIAPEPAQQLQQALRPFTGGAKDEGGDLGGALKVALLRLLEAVATHRGLLVLLDDWHAADGPSHKLLNALLELTSKAPIAWVVATNQPVGDALAETPLPPLPADEVARMVASNLGCEQLDEAVASQIVAATQGSPRFIEELLRYLLATRQLVRRQAGWQLVSGGGHALPNGLQSLYAARIADLSDEALRLVRLLSLHAASLSAEMAACALEVSQATIDEALATLQTRQFVKQDDLGFRLSDPQFAAWLASQLSPEEAQGLHGRLFEALAALSEEPRSLRTVNALAQHGLLGPTPLTARHWMLEAARQNLAMGAFAEARHFSQAAFEVADDMPPATCLELLEIRATAHRSLGEADLALSVSEEAVRLADMLGDVTLLARSLNGLGKIHQLASRYEAARAAFERATEVAKDQAPLELCRSL